MRQFIFLAGALLLGIALGPGTAAAGKPIANPNFTAPPAKEGYSYPDCYCTDSKGKRVDLGQRTCLMIGSRQVMALCDISVNNTIWRHESGGCPGV